MKRCFLLLLAGWVTAARLPSAVLREDFASDPAAHGWQLFGASELFRWDSVNHRLAVEWNSTYPNSYFYHSLGTVLGKTDDAQFSFDLQLEEISVGVNPGKPFTFEIAVALLNWRDATSTNFLRGTGRESPNLIEFDYFPDSGFGATISPIVVSSNNTFVPSFTFPLELTAGSVFQVELRYIAAERTLTATLLRDGEPHGAIKPVVLGEEFSDYRVDTFAIASYSDSGAGGSVRVKGIIDNIEVRVPDPPQARLTGTPVAAGYQASFVGDNQWSYVLERTTDWATWLAVSDPVAGTGELQSLTDRFPSGAGTAAFYRVRQERP